MEEEEEVGILLDPPVVGEIAFFWINVFKVSLYLVLLKMPMRNEDWMRRKRENWAHFVQSHAVLNEQSYPGIEKADVALEDKILLGLSGNARLEIPQSLLG